MSDQNSRRSKPLSRVREKHGSYYYDAGKDETGKRRWIKLCRIAEGELALYKALARVLESAPRTLGETFDAFLGAGLSELSPATQRDYAGYIRRTLRPVFEHVPLGEISPSEVAQYLELRALQGAAVVANREIACLSSVYNFAMRRGWVDHNPCRGARRNRERPKHRYVRDSEFLAAFEAAPEPLQDFMAVLYLTGLRPGEVRRLRRDQLHPKEIRIEESKTGKVRIISWSPALSFFALRAQRRAPSAETLLTNSRGQPWSEWALHSAMERLRKKVGGEPFTFHDLRAKAESDSAKGMGLLSLYKRVRRTEPVR